MKILIIHNLYKEKGGEDAVFESEYNLLKSRGHDVRKLIFDNKQISSFKEKFFAGIYGFYNLNSAKILKKESKNFGPDVIHVHNFFPLASPSIFYIAKKCNVPVVLTLHNFRLICPNALLFRNGHICEACIDKCFPYSGVINKCYRNSLFQTLLLSLIVTIHKLLKTWHTKIDKFIVLTEFQKNKFLSSNIKIPENKLVIKPNFSEDYGVGVDRKDFFLYVGRLSKEKGVKTLLEATKYSSFKLKIVGEGELKKEVLKYSVQNKNVEYLGFKTKEEVINLMKQSKALIFPSLWYEGFPMVLVEALSTGTPIITSNIGSQASIVEDGKTGLHFEVGNPKDLAQKIEMFLNKNVSAFYGNARKAYLERYTPDKNYKQLIGIYKEVINASKEKSNKH